MSNRLQQLANSDHWKLHSGNVGAVRDLIDILSAQFALGSDTVSSVTYDGSSRLTSFVADGKTCTIGYPDSTHINIDFRGEMKSIVLDGAGKVTGITTVYDGTY